MPVFPCSNFSQTSCVPTPRQETTPTPVTTTLQPRCKAIVVLLKGCMTETKGSKKEFKQLITSVITQGHPGKLNVNRTGVITITNFINKKFDVSKIITWVFQATLCQVSTGVL